MNLRSNKGVLRGFIIKFPLFHSKVSKGNLEGTVLDVVVDIRKSSQTFGQHISFELTAKNKYQLYVPHGFAHGFVVLSTSAIVSYKVDNYYSPEYERGIAFDDINLGIDWRLPKENLQLSEKDKNNPIFADIKDTFS
jgi:dTDP-4-dehydrorhamnose 3,5-epimerase